MTAKKLVEELGGYRVVAGRLGVGHTTLHTHLSAGKIPAKWFEAMNELCAEVGLPVVPKNLFSFAELKSAPSDSGQDEAAA